MWAGILTGSKPDDTRAIRAEKVGKGRSEWWWPSWWTWSKVISHSPETVYPLLNTWGRIIFWGLVCSSMGKSYRVGLQFPLLSCWQGGDCKLCLRLGVCGRDHIIKCLSKIWKAFRELFKVYVDNIWIKCTYSHQKTSRIEMLIKINKLLEKISWESPHWILKYTANQ